MNRDGEKILDSAIVSILKEYRASIEFTNGGGARKLSKYLAIEQRIYINHKKIYRLCDENDLLLFRQEEKKKRKELSLKNLLTKIGMNAKKTISEDMLTRLGKRYIYYGIFNLKNGLRKIITAMPIANTRA